MSDIIKLIEYGWDCYPEPHDSDDFPWFYRDSRESGGKQLATNDQAYLLQRLWESDERWGELTAGGFIRLKKLGSNALTHALRQVSLDKPKLETGPYPLLLAIMKEEK